MQKNLLLQEFEDLKRAIILLKESIKKFNPYKTEKKYTPDELEYYDSLSFRFEKSVEPIEKYLTKIITQNSRNQK